MAVSAFTVANIKPSLNIDSAQRFIFGLDGFPEPLGAFKLDNIFVPVVGTPAVTNFETRNNTLSGFRWIQTTTNTDTHGSLRLQSFINAQPTGTDILFFNNDNTVVINNLSATSPFYINYNAPLSALYLRGPSSTQAGFVYSNTVGETRLFGANDLRISSTSGVIHLGFGAGTDDTITLNTQSFTSIVDLITNNPDTSGFIPEKGLIFKTLGNQRGALTFDNVSNQLKLYTTTNDPIVIATNNTNALQVLTSGNIDLLSHRITNASDPVNAQDYVTKNYLTNYGFQVPALVNVTGGTQTFQFNAATAKFILGNTTSPSVNEYQVNFGGSIGGLRMGVSGDSPSNQFSYINTTGGSPIYLQSDGVTKMYMNGLGSFVIGTSPVGFPYAKFDVHGGELNVLNEESVIRATSSTGSSKIEINNTSASGHLYELRSNSDGTFDIVDRTAVASRFKILTNGNLDMINHSIVNVINPVNSLDVANKQYVDNSISNYASSNPVSLTGAVTGINSIGNPIFTSFANTIPVSGANQIFNFSLNSNVVYRLNNTLAATTGTPSTIALSLNNATNGGYRFIHTSTSTDPAGLGTLKLQALNSSGVSADVFTASVNPGNGITDTLFNGTATFNNTVTVQNNQSLIVTGNSSIADYLVMNNTNVTSKTQLRINVTGLPVATFGYDAAASQVYIDSPFGAGSPFVIKFAGTTKFSIDNSTGNINLFNSRITNGANPINPQDLTTKNYVDSLLTTFGPNVPLNFSGLNFNWTYASGTNPTPYQFTNTLTDSQVSKNFKYRVSTTDVSTREWNNEYILIGNSDLNGIYNLNYNSVAGTTTAISVLVYPFAASQNRMLMGVPIDMGGFEVKNALSPTTPQSLATKAYVDATAGSPTVTLIGAVTGTGTGTIATTLTPTVNVNSASYAFNLNNANASGITEFQISYGIPYLKFGVNSAGAGNYIDSIFDNFIIKMGGVNTFFFSSTGNFGVGGSTPLLGKIVVNGGVQNITNEDSALRVISALNSVKIELSNTSASGKLYELRSNSDGSFGILDRTASTNRIVINTSGNIGIGGNTIPNAALQFGNVITNRRLVLYDSSNTDHQYYGFGINNSILRYQVDQLASDHVFYAGSSSTTSNELYRVKGNGDTITAGTIFGRRVSGLITMQNNAIGTTVITANIFVKVAGTTVASNLNGVSSPVSNRITHTATNSIIAYVNVAFTAIHNGGGGEETTFALYKNGAQLPNTINSSQQLNNLQAISITTSVNMNTNDFIELWCTSPNNGRVITVKNLMFNYTTT